jgi:signal transduction histidine kinase
MRNILQKITEYFPIRLPSDEEEHHRFFLYIVLASSGVLTFFCFAFYHCFRGEYAEGIRDAATGFFLLISILIVFRIHRKIIIYHLNVCALYIVVFYIFFDGGTQGERIHWMYTLPIVAFFLLGRKNALPLVIMSYAVIGAVFFNIPPLPAIPYSYLPEVKLRFLTAYLLICLFAYIYETMRYFYQEHLKEEHEKLQQEILRRQHIEEALQHSHAELEERVKERTWELVEAKELALEAKEAALEAQHTAEAAQRTSEVADLAKTNFLYSMSHELRTPLNSVLGFAQLLANQSFGMLNSKQMQYVQRILNSGHHLLELINDVLDLSQIELGKMHLTPGKVELKSLLENSIKNIREKDLRETLSITLHFPQEVERIRLVADSQKLKQILFQLLSNAVKFTPADGAIEIDVEQQQESLIINVSDTGIGIDPEDQEQIFSNFYQNRGGLRDKTPGTGLGLPLARRLVELHGGQLWVSSEGKGKGSRFSFSLPLHTPIQEREEVPEDREER